MAPAWRLLLMAMAVAAALLPASAETPASPEGSGALGDCPMPPELGEIRGHVLVRATANEKGQLLFVKSLYSALEPPKKRKMLFSSLKKCLKAKHFSQAVVDVDFAIRTEFLLAYHYFEPASDDAPRVPISNGRKVPRRWLEEMREEKLRLAESLFAKSRRRELTGDGWSLRTDVSREHVASIERGLRVAEKEPTARPSSSGWPLRMERTATPSPWLRPWASHSRSWSRR